MGSRILFSLYLLIGLGLFITFDIGTVVWLSFFVNFLMISGIFYYHLFLEKIYSPFLSAYVIFNFLFFTVAPIVQIISFTDFTQEFATLLNYSDSLVLHINVLIFTFHVVFFLCYRFLLGRTTVQESSVLEYTFKPEAALVIVICTGLLLLIFLVTLDFVIYEMDRPSYINFNISTSEYLIKKKVMFILPLAVIALGVEYTRRYGKNSINTIIVILCICLACVLLVWFKNPLVEKRNALGPVVLSVLFIFKPRWLNTNAKTSALLFFALVIAFPLTAIVTHVNVTLEQVIKKPILLLEHNRGGGILETFNTLNYDAFANIGATIDYVEINDHTDGLQLLSNTFFFIPRSIWPDKPLSTGELVGDHLIDHHGFDFNNLSNPLVSEGYIDFGILGTCLMAFLLAVSFVVILPWLGSPDILKRVAAFYFAIHLVFLLRGSLMSGFAYYIGALIGLILIPRIIQWSTSYLLSKSTV